MCSAVFWLGDLNYRLDNIDNDECKERISKGQLDDLWRNNDQVISQKMCSATAVPVLLTVSIDFPNYVDFKNCETALFNVASS